MTRNDLRRVINEAYRKGLSEKTLSNIRGVLSGFCGYLDECDIRNDLSTRFVRIPQNAKKSNKQSLTAEGIYLVFSCDYTVLNNEEVYDDLVNAYRIGIALGLRPGEIMGLQWGDITDDYIHIQRAINAKGMQTSGKNAFANRFLPQTRFTRGIFNAQARLFPTLNPTSRVFGDYSEITYCARWKRFCAHNGIAYVTPYELRHTFASIYKTLLKTWILDELMGHVHSGITQGVYSHPLAGDMDKVVPILEQGLNDQYNRGKKQILSLIGVADE